MKNIAIQCDGCVMEFSLGMRIAELIAKMEHEETSLIAWCDTLRQTHSPQCLQCEIKGGPSWEVYGRNHGVRLRISFNQDALVSYPAEKKGRNRLFC